MPENPNPTPTFIRAGGVLGLPVLLTSQNCSRAAPGNIPLILYDNRDNYASGNGAIVENLTVCATGPITRNVLFLFLRFINPGGLASAGGITEWLLWHEIDLPATTQLTTTTKDPLYPLRGPLKRIYNPMPHTGGTPFCDGLRINGESRPLQIGVATGAAVSVNGTSPLIVWLEGGEL